MNRLAFIAMSTVLSFASFGLAQAATVYDLNLDHCSSGCGKSDYGTVTVAPTNGGDTLNVSVSLDPSVFFNQAGKGFDAIAFDLVGNPTVTIGGLPSNFSLNGSQNVGSHHEDGLGSWGYVVDWVGPPTNNGSLGVETLNFTVTGTAPLELGFNTVDGKEVFFSVDIASVLDSGAVATGVVGATMSAVPEPAAWSLMILGLGGLGAVLRMRRRSAMAMALA